MHILAPSSTARAATWTIVHLLIGTAAYLAWRYTDLPDLLPVHFTRRGAPNGWQYKTLARVMTPVLVQAVLAATLGAVALLLRSRGGTAQDAGAPDARAAVAAAETVMLIALVWIAFQAYAAVAVVRMWSTNAPRLGTLYTALECAGAAATVAIALRGHRRIGRPAARPYVAAHWRLSQLYRNADDPALFVPTRDGSRWTLNFGRPGAAALLGLMLAVGIAGPTIVLVLALRYKF